VWSAFPEQEDGKLPPLGEDGSLSPRRVPVGGEAPPALSPVRRPRLLRPRVALLFAVALMAIALVAGAGWYLQRPAPEKTLATFCSALTAHDLRSAYAALTPALQRRVPWLLFSGLLGTTEQCSASAPLRQGARATATLTLLLAHQRSAHQVTLVETSSNSWLIDQDAALTALPDALAAYCSALTSGQAAAAYARLTPAFQHRVSLKLFALLVSGVKSCSTMLMAVTPAQAQAVVVVRYASEPQPETNVASLLAIGKSWAFDALSALSSPARSLLAFCSALQSHDDATAYELLSAAFQARFGDERHFMNVVDPVLKNNGGIKSCTVVSVQVKNGWVIGTSRILYQNGTSETDSDELLEERGIWRIAAIS
jgi:hypothetical protein